METVYLADKFKVALLYADYLKTGTEEHQRRWALAFESSKLTDAQTQLIASFTRKMNVLVISGIWCGDCATQCPLLQRIASANPTKIDVRWLDRDLHKDLSEQLKINGGVRVPMAIFMAEDYEHCGVYGERPLSRYRVLAQAAWRIGSARDSAAGDRSKRRHAAGLVE